MDFLIGILIFFIITGISIARLIKKAGSEGVLNRFAELLKESQAESAGVRIYDENGRPINSSGSGAEWEETQQAVIYDEDGNVMIPRPRPPKERIETPEPEVVREAETPVTEPDAERYREFIRANGGSAIVIREILDKPLALRQIK
ncbi:MAG: hypothetical protein PHV59_00075 [Victivallales bacterium]|nr:hypothetical protein [Victivallales bacterium]